MISYDPRLLDTLHQLLPFFEFLKEPEKFTAVIKEAKATTEQFNAACGKYKTVTAANEYLAEAERTRAEAKQVLAQAKKDAEDSAKKAAILTQDTDTAVSLNLQKVAAAKVELQKAKDILAKEREAFEVCAEQQQVKEESLQRREAAVAITENAQRERFEKLKALAYG